MIKITLLLFSLLISGCSFKTPVNEWQYKSSSAFNMYTKDFLTGDETLAKNDLSRAIMHAKKSADLSQLARIYLGECALNISVGVQESCDKYRSISHLVNDDSLDAYYHLIQLSIKKEQIQYLPKSYRSFAQNLLKNNFKTLNEEILTVPKATSIFISAALIKEHISRDSREKILNLASHHGYKKVVLFWLHESIKKSQNQVESKELQKRVSILSD